MSCPIAQGGGGTGGGGTFQVNNVTPNPLVLGASGTLTISGSNFLSITSPIATFGTNSGITTGTPNITPDGATMTVSYQVTCGALLGNQTLKIGESSDGGVSGATWIENVNLPSAPAPTIKLGGNGISGTQSVVVGQQIALSSSVSLPACMSISSQQWTPSQSATAGTPVGGYTASSSSGSVTPLPPNTSSTYTFYWVYPTNGVTATYRYTMSGGGGSVSSPVSTATFNITGPTGGNMSSIAQSRLSIATLSGCGSFPAGPYLMYAAGATGSHCSLVVTAVGINFNSPTGYSNSSGGSFLVGQLVSHETLTGGGTTYGPGLDSSWPYGPGTLPTNDNPHIYLASTYRTLTRDFQATMFLMWKSSTSNSILVPLGYQTWGFSATASCTTSCGSASNWTATTQSAGLVGGFTVSSASQSSVGQNTLQYGYPTWTSVSY